MSNKEKRTKWFLSHRYAYYVIFATSLNISMSIANSIFLVDTFNWIECINTFLWMYWATYPAAFWSYELTKKRIEKSQNKEK